MSDDTDPLMTVAQLIEALEKFPPDMPVFLSYEFVKDISTVEVERVLASDDSISGFYPAFMSDDEAGKFDAVMLS